ncbi:chloride channel protein [Legionella sp. WA2022007384]
MGFIALALVKWVATEASGNDIQEIEGTLLHERPIFVRRSSPVKFVVGVFSIGSKMVLGCKYDAVYFGCTMEHKAYRYFVDSGRQSTYHCVVFLGM